MENGKTRIPLSFTIIRLAAKGDDPGDVFLIRAERRSPEFLLDLFIKLFPPTQLLFLYRSITTTHIRQNAGADNQQPY